MKFTQGPGWSVLNDRTVKTGGYVMGRVSEAQREMDEKVSAEEVERARKGMEEIWRKARKNL